jgi:hypothetical protein
MDQGSLVIEETDAGAELVRRFNAYMPVEAAFWIKSVDDGRWTLYISSNKIDEKTFDLGYGEVLRLAQEMKNPYIDPFRVQLVTETDPLAQAAVDIHRRYPGNMATRFGGKEFGGMPVEGAHIYPASVVKPTT